MLEKPYGTSVLGKELAFWVLSTPDNIANLDAGRKDGPFWAGVRDGSVSEAAGAGDPIDAFRCRGGESRRARLVAPSGASPSANPAGGGEPRGA